MKKLLTISLVLLSINCMGQQTARFSNYLFNPLALNPAAAGSYDYVNIMGIYRQQWTGLEGSPTTTVLSVDGAVRERTIGLGLQYINEQIGAQSQNAFTPTVAYRLRVGETQWLSAGFSVGVFNSKLNGTELIFKDVNETAIPNNSESVTYVDINSGFYFQSAKTTIGLSIVNLLKPSLRYSGGRRGELGEINRHYNFYAGYLIDLNSKFALQPSVLLKTSEKLRSFQTDFTGMVFYNNMLGAGLSYRNQESVNIIVDYWINDNFRLGYAFDITTSKIARYENGSHEIMLAYKIAPTGGRMLNPRNFYNN